MTDSLSLQCAIVTLYANKQPAVQETLQAVTQGCERLYQESAHFLQEILQFHVDGPSLLGKIHNKYALTHYHLPWHCKYTCCPPCFIAQEIFCTSMRNMQLRHQLVLLLQWV